MLDFSQTRVRVTTLSIPISDQLGTTLLGAFERNADAARVEEVDENSFLVADGYTQEILLSGRSCVELKNPPPESAAGMIAGPS